jgi:inorganic triphosphatase YgiF
MARASGQSGQKMLKALEKTHHQAEPVASSFLFDQVAALLCYDPSVRSGEQDASHAMSAAAGRVWSALGDRKLFNRTAVDELRAELTWLTESLAPLSHSAPVQGEARSNPENTGPVQGTEYEAAYDRALAALESARYFRLVADLQRVCSTPPVRQPRRRHLYRG